MIVWLIETRVEVLRRAIGVSIVGFISGEKEQNAGKDKKKLAK